MKLSEYSFTELISIRKEIFTHFEETKPYSVRVGVGVIEHVENDPIVHKEWEEALDKINAEILLRLKRIRISY